MAEEPETLRAQFAIDKAQEQANIRMSGPHIPTKEVRLPGATDYAALEGLATWTSKKLPEVRECCSASPISVEDRDRALKTLQFMGATLQARILGRYRSMTQSLGPGTLAYGKDHPPIMDLEVFCHDKLVLPAEILPLLAPFDPTRDVDDPLLKAAALVGFGAACHRPTALRAESDDALLDRRAVRFYWHADLKGAHKQWDRLSARFSVCRGPFPERREDRSTLVDRIVRKEGGPGGGLITSAVEHFHCHHDRGGDGARARRGDTDTTKPLEDVMRLKPRRWSWFTPEVRLGADEVAERSNGQPPKAGLVFLNACNSQQLSPWAVGSFAREFLHNGRNAVVTTWSDVPDDVALGIATYFYEALFRGETVGASLREARVRLLLEQNNPLGLLYTVYGDSRFRLIVSRNEAKGART